MNRNVRNTKASAIALVWVGLGVGCASEVAAPPEVSTCNEPGAKLCLAFASDFANFVSWSAVPGESDIVPNPGEVHAGPRTVYINKKPPRGAKTFPVGTIIVKDIALDPDVRLHRVFAMVKHGGEFNVGTNTATGWEWFELIRAKDESATVRWQGLGPPAGEKYSGDKAGGCNGCHSAGRDNDFVLTRGLKLTP
jgi:hypothetical protein